MRQRKLDAEVILERVSDMERTLEFLKRDIIKGFEPSEEKTKISLFGSVKAGDITEEMIDEAKRSLFRDLDRPRRENLTQHMITTATHKGLILHVLLAGPERRWRNATE